MKIETLKELVKKIRISTELIEKLKAKNLEKGLTDEYETDMINQFLELLDLFEKDNQEETSKGTDSNPWYPNSPNTITYNGNDMIPYSEICTCNPKNGGSGICHCIMANQLVPNPNKK